MKLIIFAGGIGTRMWPLSREMAPKQFDKIFNGKSTLQLAIERVAPAFSIGNVFIQTVPAYVSAIREQLPDLPAENIIVEPARRNLGPAVCLTVTELEKRGIGGPMALLWADHLMTQPEAFVNALKEAEALIELDPNRFVFMGEKPRFANNNLGWITIGDSAGEINGTSFYSFAWWKYKPTPEFCAELFASGKAYWNPGYFITSVGFLKAMYERHAPQIYQAVSEGRYEEAEATHFDRAIAERLEHREAVVLLTDMGWSDPGTLYALKEALAESTEANHAFGNVTELHCTDSLLYNTEESKLLAAVGLCGFVVVNTPDALLVAPKDEVVHITALVKKLNEEGKRRYI